MNELLEKFKALSLPKKIGIAAGSLLLVVILFWQYLYSPISKQKTELSEKVDTLQGQIAQQQRIIRNLPIIQAEVRTLDDKLAQVLKELPDKREIPDLLTSISDLAVEAGLEISKFTPRGESPQDFYSEVPVDIVVEGTFHQLATFFDEVGRLQRIVNINNVSVGVLGQKPGGGKIPIRSNCTATTFRYLDESERSRSQEGEGGDQKKRRET
jgi:type IV pilus assembly protein PilO